MPGGLVALLDDVAGLTKLAAASLDDVGAAAGKAGSKAIGVVVDDTAVTPRYAMGLSPERELPIIGRIALGSLRNKLLFLLPAALLLSSFAPSAVTPLLMLGGAYLTFEAVEKIVHALTGHAEVVEGSGAKDPTEVEEEKVSGAIRTDFILSAEIMAIALSDVAASPFATRAAVLALVGIAITAGVYGVVALIVKMDDIGLGLARRSSGLARAVGRLLVKGMPVVMRALSVIGTAAMLWVGGGIIVHGLEVFHLDAIPHAIHQAAAGAARFVPFAHGIVHWIVTAVGSSMVGAVVGGCVLALLHLAHRVRGRKDARA